ncbi:hypothetical protein B9G98_04061 [Wickerhamiella sorbophila]|uniref:Lipid droplet-associated hydrolase n=1 Tax=Wickerhamiella sorbophila TaxID=45607 RepID=A0A2T0FN72_9ASCO|nr:hypothetical protein B9G98_04061 [Wickerhamiella sorbophila]PRT56441.1 hypothetical protein B9G98_04061 [Wickerhamiella sorbophila]
MAAQITKVDGTTVVHVASEKPSDPLIYLIPGNPGLCEYYLDFVNELASLLPGHEIVAPSHRGYSLDSKPGELTLRSYNLDDQIRHKIELLEALVTQQRKVIVLGHSVGAWIAQRVVTHFKNHTNVNIEFVGLLTPTVKDIAQSPRGLKVTKLGRYLSPGFLAGALRVLYYVMPGSFWQYLMNRLFRKSKNPDYARQVSLRYAQRPSMVYQTLSLATEEMTTIGSDTEPHDIAGFWDSTRYTIWGFFAHDDHWVAPKTRQALFDAYGDKPNVHFEIVPDQTIPHAFCINRSREAADYVAAAIIKFEKQSLVESIEELKPLEVVPEVQTAEALAQKQSQAPREALGTSENVSEDSTLKLAPKLEEAPKLVAKLEGKLEPKPVKAEPKSAATSAAASAAKSAAQSASKAHSPLERIATPTSQISKDSDGSKTPQSTASKESGRKSSMRRLGKALSRKKKQA